MIRITAPSTMTASTTPSTPPTTSFFRLPSGESVHRLDVDLGGQRRGEEQRSAKLAPTATNLAYSRVSRDQ